MRNDGLFTAQMAQLSPRSAKLKNIPNKLCVRPSQYAPAAPCKLTFWPLKWCPSHVWRGLPLCQF